jgi:gliding motility-associated-like protein
VIYQSVCAGCGGIDLFPTTPGAWSRTNNSTNCNNALMKFDFEYPITIAAFSFAPPIETCEPSTVLFTNFSTNAQSHQWLINGQPISTDKDLSHTFNTSGNYVITLVAINQNTCNISDTVSRNLVITVPDIVAADVTYEKFGTCEGVDVLLNGSGADQLKWLFPGGGTADGNATQIKVPYNDTIQVKLVVYDGLCTDTAIVTEILKGLPDYYKQNDANVFSPNNDGINDCFSPALQIQPDPYDKAFLECSELYVYNRWGELVFDSPKSIGNGCWSGQTTSGQILPEGVYFYRYLFEGKEYPGLVHLRLN